MSIFGAYARYYDLLNATKDYGAETSYVDSLLRTSQTPPRSILELGCGTGRHACLLANKGYEVTGVDASEEMVRIAEQRADGAGHDSLDFHQADVRSFRAGRKFDAVISLFHVLSYQQTDEDLERMLDTARSHLLPGHVFLFDFWYGPAVLKQRPEVRSREWEDDSVTAKRIALPSLHLDEHIVDVRFEIEVKEKTTGRVHRFNEIHRMRYLYMPEIDDLLSRSGFEIQLAEEWLTGKVPDSDTWSVVVLARAI